jgi:hypothetical protein
MTPTLIIALMKQANELLTTATVIVAFSLLLYNLTYNRGERVIRASAVLLACVTIIYVGDVFVALTPSTISAEFWLRVQWLGMAVAPAALFHLSDALLSTTGLVSRGRRRRIVRLLYLTGLIFSVVAIFTDALVHNVQMKPLALMFAGPLFPVYSFYYVAACFFAFNNVLRARRRALTRATHRRLSYLLFGLITPIVGIFPFSLLLPNAANADPLWLWLPINAGNLAIVLMLVFMAYPLSFFGPKKSDRAIKSELLRFMLRGPFTGIAALVVIVTVPQLSAFGISGATLMPLIAVATILALQWSYTVIIPFLERRLIYTDDEEQVRRIQSMAQQLLTPTDAAQLLEANLAALCDFLRVPSAFVAAFNPNATEAVSLEQSIGPLLPKAEQLNTPEFLALFNLTNGQNGHNSANGGAGAGITLIVWQSFWLVALYTPQNKARHIGCIGIWARSPMPDLLPEEENVLRAICGRVVRVLRGVRAQEELFSRLEDALESETDSAREVSQLNLSYVGEAARLSTPPPAAEADLLGQPDFVDLIRDSLRDYDGGERLTDPRFLSLTSIERLMAENENNLAKAVRALLNRALERLKPEGAHSYTLPEWTLYNVINLRFIQAKKVREVARQLARAEADIYRKQRLAIEQMAVALTEIERRAREEKVDV